VPARLCCSKRRFSCRCRCIAAACAPGAYNQSALLARALARLAQRPAVLDALQRIRFTASLGEKSGRERAAEVAGAFVVQPGREGWIAGRRVLLIDDVLTSGATANACARALLAKGAAQVDVLVAARVPDRRLD